MPACTSYSTQRVRFSSTVRYQRYRASGVISTFDPQSYCESYPRAVSGRPGSNQGAWNSHATFPSE